MDFERLETSRKIRIIENARSVLSLLSAKSANANTTSQISEIKKINIHLKILQILKRIISKARKKLFLVLDKPLITVIITEFNASNELKIAINSVLGQTFSKFRLIIIDDASDKKETHEILQEFKNVSNVSIITLKKNRGLVHCRNLGLKYSKTMFTLFLDSDDSLVRNYLEKGLFNLLANPSKMVGVPDVISVNSENSETWEVGDLGSIDFNVANRAPLSSIFVTKTLKRKSAFLTKFTDGLEDWAFWNKAWKNSVTFSPFNFAGYFYDSTLNESGRTFNAKASNATNSREMLYIKKSLIQKKNYRAEFYKSYYRQLMLSDTSFFYVNYGRNSSKTAFLVFAPWLTRTGGADDFIFDLLLDMSKNPEIDIIFVTTEHQINDVHKIRVLTENQILVYELNKFVGHNQLEFIKNLIMRYMKVSIINFGSIWLNNNYSTVNSHRFSQIKQNVYYIFNHVGHLPSVIKSINFLDKVICAYNELKVTAEILSGSTHKFIVLPVPIPINQISATPNLKISKRQVNTDKLLSKNTELLNIGWIGRLGPEKRFDWFINLSLTAKSRVNFYCAGPDEVEIDRLINDFKSPVSNLGFLSDDNQFFSLIDVLVITSSIEGIPITALKAIKQSCKIFSTDVGGMFELSESYPQVTISPAKNYLEFAEKFDEFIENQYLNSYSHRNKSIIDSSDLDNYFGLQTIKKINSILDPL
jgi:glycosyltransferase involved in cell wall biosynthesis